jgi:hypothetical protein
MRPLWTGQLRRKGNWRYCEYPLPSKSVSTQGYGGQSQIEMMRSSHISISTKVIAAYGLLAAVLFALVAGGVVYSRSYIENNTIEIGELQTVSQSVDGAGATSVEAEIILGFGEMTISGDADELLELEFTSNIADMHPVVTYQVEDGAGDLHVEPLVSSGIPDPTRFDKIRNEWDVRLNNHTPLDLRIIMGFGEGKFDLTGLILTGLEVEIGTGEATIDLSGEWQRTFDATVEGGVGETTLLLPPTIGVRVSVDQGIGEVNVVGLEPVGDGVYINPAYDDSDDMLHIEVDVGVGELNLEVRDKERE